MAPHHVIPAGVPRRHGGCTGARRGVGRRLRRGPRATAGDGGAPQPRQGRVAKDGRFTIDTTSGAMTANVVVFTQRCRENLLGTEVVAMWPCAECAGVPWILGPQVAQSLSYRLANL